MLSQWWRVFVHVCYWWGKAVCLGHIPRDSPFMFLLRPSCDTFLVLPSSRASFCCHSREQAWSSGSWCLPGVALCQWQARVEGYVFQPPCPLMGSSEACSMLCPRVSQQIELQFFEVVNCLWIYLVVAFFPSLSCFLYSPYGAFQERLSNNLSTLKFLFQGLFWRMQSKTLVRKQ